LRELASLRYFKNTKRIKLSLERVATDRCYFRTGREVKIPGTLYAEKLSGFEGGLIVTQKPFSREKLNVLSKELGNIRNIVAGDEKGILVGLLDEKGDTLGMGRIEEIDYKKNKILLLAPVRDGGKIRVIQFGSLRITPEGREAGFVSPGYF
jgi:polynucleotide 5'-kinase involved in rRNA processing